MKLSINRLLNGDQLVDLENHVIETVEEEFMTEEPHLVRLAVDGVLEVKSETLAKEIIDFLSLNVPRIIIWKDDKKVVDKFGNSPKDFDADLDESVLSIVDRLLEDGEDSRVEQAEQDFSDDCVDNLDEFRSKSKYVQHMVAVLSPRVMKKYSVSEEEADRISKEVASNVWDTTRP